jgi:hypothetical protein
LTVILSDNPQATIKENFVAEADITNSNQVAVKAK